MEDNKKFFVLHFLHQKLFGHIYLQVKNAFEVKRQRKTAKPGT